MVDSKQQPAGKKPRKPRTSFGKGGRRPDIPAPVKSAWEANIYRFYTWLLETDQLISFEYEPQRFDFPVKAKTGPGSFYIPDFKVVYPGGETVYVEVKGYMDKISSTKLKRFKKYYPSCKLDIIGKAAYKAIQEEYAEVIPRWEF